MADDPKTEQAADVGGAGEGEENLAELRRSSQRFEVERMKVQAIAARIERAREQAGRKTPEDYDPQIG